MKTDRVVFDTNTLVSAVLIGSSLPAQALDVALAKGTLLQAEKTYAELESVLMREKFNRYISVNARLQFLATIAQVATFVQVSSVVTDCRDPKDNRFLELALDGAADLILSGDRDLLSMHPYRGIPILSAGDYLQHFG